MPTGPQAQTQPAGDFRDFGLITNTDGWVLVGNQLNLTTSGGAGWSDITPAMTPSANIQAVQFLDNQMGWVLWSDSQADGSQVLQIAHTSDQGKSWNNSLVQTLSPDDPDADMESASMLWLDENTGWVSIKRRTGTNFSSGTLFRTEDGGLTWQRLALPIGGPVYFVNSTLGWMAGGPAGDQLFKTMDAGSSWQAQTPPALQNGLQRISISQPVFDSPENGLLAVVTLNGQDFQLEINTSVDGGQKWSMVSSLPLGALVSRPPLSLLDGRDLVGSVPNSDRIIRMVKGAVNTVLNQDGMSAGIVDLKMLTSDFGWARWNTADCTTTPAAAGGASNVACSSTTKLIETQNGGITWQALALPAGFPGLLTPSLQTASTGVAQVLVAGEGKTLLQVGQGFDICTIPTLAQLQAWWTSSPYKSVNLYIGGSARACANPTLTAAYIAQMRAQGWTFIPTWVGPQAPCTTFISHFSYNNSYTEGRDQAFLAASQMAALGLTNADLTGSVVYYDMEAYSSTDQSCRDAVKDFVDGWVTHLHELGNLAGVYGSTLCNTGLSDYMAIPNVPDAIWPARWYHNAPDGTYDPNASVWDIGTCIPTTAWSNHQRIRQYAGDHAETWGATTLGGIDSDVLDGIVAAPYFGSPSAQFNASPLSGSAALTVTFHILNTAFISSCSWVYGDGQTGNSCASSHTHTYANPGTYTVSLTVSSPWGTGDSLTISNYITVNTTIDHFAISAIASPQTAGTAISGITLTAQDINSNTVTGFTGTVTYSGTAGVSGTSPAFTAGRLTGVSVTPTLAGSSRTFIVSAYGKTGTSTFNVNPGALDHFGISTIASPQTAGTAITGITLTAKDAYNNTVTGFTGTVAYSGTAGITGSSSAFTAGQLTGVSATPTVAGSNKSFVITGSGKTGTSTFNVNPGALDHFIISTIASPQTAGIAITGITLTAQDVYNNTKTDYTGTVTYSGTAGVTGSSSGFNAGQLTNVSVTPTLAGSARTLIVTGSGKTGSSSFTVNPGALDHFDISTIASPQTAGTAITGIALTARDVYNNTVTSYTSTVTYSGTAGVAGSSSAFIAGQLTGVSVTPTTAGTGKTLIVTGAGKTGTSTFTVNPGPLDHFLISAITSPQTAGSAIPGITLTAQDLNNNTVTSYTTTVTYSGTAGVTGSSAAFSAGRLTGVSITPTLAGSGKTFIVTGSGKTGTSTFNVNPGALNHFEISTIASPQTAGTAITGITLTAHDLYNNTVTSFTGTVTYSGTAGVTGSSAAFSAGQLAGVSVTPTSAGSGKTFIVTGSGKTGTSTFTVNPGALDHFIISAIASPQTAGIAITGITLTAKDLYNNTVTGFTGTVIYSGTAGVSGTSPAFAAGLLAGLSVTPTAAGSGMTFIVTGSGKTGTSTFNVNPGALDHFGISPIASPQMVGTAITGITLTAQDRFNNTVTSFTGTVVYSGTAGVTGSSPAFSAGRLANLSVTPTIAGVGKTLIVTGSGKTGTSTFDVSPALDHFVISVIASPQTAGTAITGITLTAQDINNNTLTGFTGTVTYSGTAGVTGTSPAFSAGQLTGVSVTPTIAGSARTFVISGFGKTATRSFDVNPGALDHFLISTIPSPQLVGAAITGITLTAKDLYNNTVTGFTGTVAYSGTAGVTGSSPAFSAGQVAGVSITPTLVGSARTFIVTGSGKTGTSTFDVISTTLDHFAITGIPSVQTAGTAITGITLTAQDINNSTVTNFTGTVTYSGTAGVTGTSSAFTAGRLTGVSVTPTLAGTGRTFIVSASGKTGTSTLQVNPAAMNHFSISPIASPQTVGVAITGITLTAQDIYNNTVTGFSGTVTYSGTAGITGKSPGFIAGQLTGVSVTPTVVGIGKTFIITGSGLTATSTFDVNPAMDHFAISAIASPQTAGTAITGITLTAQDINNNTVTSFTGTVTYGGTAGVTGTSPAFTAGQLNGVSVTPTIAGSGKTFTISGFGKSTTRTFDVNPGALDHFSISTIPSPQMVGVAINGHYADGPGSTTTTPSRVSPVRSLTAAQPG